MKYIVLVLVSLLPVITAAQQPGTHKAIFLEDIPWTHAEKLLTAETVVVIPVGAAAKEHGPHLPLNTDFLQAEFLKSKVAATEQVVIAPTINYSYYPPFLNFPGSTSIRHSGVKSMIVDICRSLAGHGPRRFYIINIGISTNSALKPAAAQLAKEGILLSYTNLLGPEMAAINKKILQEKEGTHAEEGETSTLLYMYPGKVNMREAKQEYGKRTGQGILIRDSTQSGLYVPSGIYGDATLATKEKGKQVTDGLLRIIQKDIDSVRNAALPAVVALDLQPYAGEYETDDKRMININAAGNRLRLEWNNRAQGTQYPEGHDYFPGLLFEAWFNRNDAGMVNAIRLTLPNGDVVYGKKKQ